MASAPLFFATCTVYSILCIKYTYVHAYMQTLCHVSVVGELQIRILHDNKISYNGYVEMHYFGSWNVLCDQGWSSGNGAEVVCRELGLGKVLEHSVIASETFMKDFLVTNTQCIGQEPFLKDCTRQENLWNISDSCLNNTVAYLYCEGLCSMLLAVLLL